MEGHDRCGANAWSLRIGFREHIDYNGTYGTLGSAYQGTYQNCTSGAHYYRLTSWHYRKWVGGTEWNGGWNYSQW